jgi:hypothetical protein
MVDLLGCAAADKLCEPRVCRASCLDEFLDQRRALFAAAAFDTRTDIDAVGAHLPDGLGNVGHGQSAREHDLRGSCQLRGFRPLGFFAGTAARAFEQAA